MALNPAPPYTVLMLIQGGDLASTWVAKPKVHAEGQKTS